MDYHNSESAEAIRANRAEREALEQPLCESGWTGDRCDFPLDHAGPHSNEQTRDSVPGEQA